MNYEDFFKEWENEAPYIEAHTSGSTGIPKKILLDKNFVISSAKRTNRFFNISSLSHLHSCISPDFIGGKMMAVRAYVANALLTWESPSNKPLQHIDKDENLDLVAVVPPQMEYIIENPGNLPHIGAIIIGGAPISKGLRHKIAESGLNAFETYGMTETASHIALRKVTRNELPFITFDDIKVSVNENQCLAINFRDGGIIQTNDIAEIVSESEFFIIGRNDNVIITGGKKVNPLELENKIGEVFKDLKFIVSGFPDEKWGEKIILIIEKKNLNYSKEYILEKCRGFLPGWQVPKEIVTVKELPKTSNGKLLRSKKMEDLSSFLS